MSFTECVIYLSLFMALTLNKECVLLATLAVFALAGPWILPVQGARILAVETIGGKSHWNFMSGILRALVDKSHNVTVFTPNLDGNRENYTEIDISDRMIKVRDLKLKVLRDRWINPIKFVGGFLKRSRNTCDNIYENDKMIEALNGFHADFDVVITEPHFSECVSYPAYKLNIPLIYVTPLPTIGTMEWYFTGHVSNPGLVSNIFASHGLPETFVQRLTNTVLTAYCVVARKYTELVLQYTEPKFYDLITPVPPSLVFVNSNFITDAPSSVPTSAISVGGIHLTTPKALPKDVLEFIEQSPHGVIYFTFGSTVRMSSLPENIMKTFIEVLAQLPQRVLWKYEDDLQDKPKNFMIKKWFPQRDILLHPKVKLFISHGGISGVYESVDAGVPVLGFPLFGDQWRNVENLVTAGMAISMDLFSVSKDTLLENVLELVNNDKYIKNAKSTSVVFKDQPISPEEKVVYWTEYIIRHNGAKHLKSHAFNLTWYQYYLLDVLVIMLALISLFFFATYSFFKSIFRCIINSSQNTKSKSE